VAAHGQAATLQTIDELGSGGVGNAEHVRELSDGDRPGFTQRKQQSKLAEGEIVMAPAWQTFRT